MKFGISQPAGLSETGEGQQHRAVIPRLEIPGALMEVADSGLGGMRNHSLDAEQGGILSSAQEHTTPTALTSPKQLSHTWSLNPYTGSGAECLDPTPHTHPGV